MNALESGQGRLRRPAGQLLLGALVELLGVRGTLATVGLLDLLIVVPLAMVSSRR